MGLKFGFFNGERYQLFNEEIIQQTLEQRPLPEYLLLTFFKDGKKYNAYLEFDEQELYNTFKLLAYDPDESLILRVSIRADLKQTSVTLQAKDKSLSLEKMKAVEIYTK